MSPIITRKFIKEKTKEDRYYHTNLKVEGQRYAYTVRNK